MSRLFYELMLVTNAQDRSIPDYLAFIKICADAGITSVQLREKEQPREQLLIFGHQLKALLTPLQIPLIVNDDLALAAELKADGVHLGQTDGDPILARNQLGPDKKIGISIDSVDNLIHANQLPVDYVGIGAIFPTSSKKNISTHWGLEGLHKLALCSKHPVIAIGGINTSNAPAVLSAGAHGLAMIGAIHEAKNPAETIKHLRQLIDRKRPLHVV